MIIINIVHNYTLVQYLSNSIKSLIYENLSYKGFYISIKRVNLAD